MARPVKEKIRLDSALNWQKVLLQSGSWACREHGNHKERQREPDSRRIAFIWENILNFSKKK